MLPKMETDGVRTALFDLDFYFNLQFASYCRNHYSHHGISECGMLTFFFQSILYERKTGSLFLTLMTILGSRSMPELPGPPS